MDISVRTWEFSQLASGNPFQKFKSGFIQTFQTLFHSLNIFNFAVFIAKIDEKQRKARLKPPRVLANNEKSHGRSPFKPGD
jgi:hypothetical protein